MPISQLFRNSIRTKLSALFLTLAILPFIGIGYYGYYTNMRSLTDNLLANSQQDVDSLAQTLRTTLDNVPDDINFLANFFTLQRYLEWHNVGEPYKTRMWLRGVRSAFSSFLRSYQQYSKIQIVNLNGQELVSIIYDAAINKITILDGVDLKNLQQETYFKQAVDMQQGKIALVDMQLAQIQKTTQQLHPLLYYSTPIFNSDHVMQGVLVLTVNGQVLLDKISQQSSQEVSSYYQLISQEGEYFFHSDTSKTWGLERNIGLKQDEPDLFNLFSNQTSGSLPIDNGIAAFRRIYPLKGNETYWTLLKASNDEQALEPVYLFRYIFMITVIGISVIVLLFSHWFTRKLTTPLLGINEQLKSLARGQLIDIELSYHSQDEIYEIITSTQQLKMGFQATIEQANAVAQGNYSSRVKLLSEQDQLGSALVNMSNTLLAVTQKNQEQDWLKTGQMHLNNKTSGEQELTTLVQNIIVFLASYLDAQLGVLYLATQASLPNSPITLKLTATYAYTRRKNLANEFALGEGLVGQAALEKREILLTQVPSDYVHIQSGLGDAVPRHIIVIPFLYEAELKGIIELGKVNEFDELELEFLRQVMPHIGVATNTCESRNRMQELLHQTQTQAEELQAQAEELQTQTEELQTQQEELSQTNQELELRTQDLERQREEVRQKNAVLEKTQQEIEAKAKELELASKYKSEFLANMSHELRTPLNSLLILAQLLVDNKMGNLTDKQIEYAKTIHSAGNDLLTLINEILDLSKVEAGKIEANVETISIDDLCKSTEYKFRHVAEEKHLSFEIIRQGDIPTHLETDVQRLKQIVNNLLSNAFKFTEKGGITLTIAHPQIIPSQFKQLTVEKAITITVQDSGIGIPKDKQHIIFEAFQQADGTTSRRYGGTGLGLSISRQLARLLGGELFVESEENQGSKFTLLIPIKITGKRSDTAQVIGKPTTPSTTQSNSSDAAKRAILEAFKYDDAEFESLTTTVPITTVLENSVLINDDRDHLIGQDRVILIIEDDPKFAKLLMELAHEKGFKCLIANNGKTGLELAEQFVPTAIFLDVGLPEIDGWTVMERLKSNSTTRHIPVHFMSGSDHTLNAKLMGAVGYMFKPVSMGDIGDAFHKIQRIVDKHLKNLLIVSDHQQRTQSIIELVGHQGVNTIIASSCVDACQTLDSQEIDCIILDIEVDQSNGIKLLEQQLWQEHRLSSIPIIIYADRALTAPEELVLQECTDKLIIKAVYSPERLLDEATLFLHQVEANLPKDKQKILRMIHDKQAILMGKKVLLIDDDARNTFALTTVLEDKEMEVIVGKNGKEALRLLEQHPNIDIVLMDIMMPEMDGYEAMQQIRKKPQFRKLPIIALTAKAMKGDKAKCIEAGANDYMTKPVDTNKLISLMRVWLYR